MFFAWNKYEIPHRWTFTFVITCKLFCCTQLYLVIRFTMSYCFLVSWMLLFWRYSFAYSVFFLMFDVWYLETKMTFFDKMLHIMFGSQCVVSNNEQMVTKACSILISFCGLIHLGCMLCQFHICTSYQEFARLLCGLLYSDSMCVLLLKGTGLLGMKQIRNSASMDYHVCHRI